MYNDIDLSIRIPDTVIKMLEKRFQFTKNTKIKKILDGDVLFVNRKHSEAYFLTELVSLYYDGIDDIGVYYKDLKEFLLENDLL